MSVVIGATTVPRPQIHQLSAPLLFAFLPQSLADFDDGDRVNELRNLVGGAAFLSAGESHRPVAVRDEQGRAGLHFDGASRYLRSSEAGAQIFNVSSITVAAIWRQPEIAYTSSATRFICERGRQGSGTPGSWYMTTTSDATPRNRALFFRRDSLGAQAVVYSPLVGGSNAVLSAICGCKNTMIRAEINESATETTVSADGLNHPDERFWLGNRGWQNNESFQGILSGLLIWGGFLEESERVFVRNFLAQYQPPDFPAP